jgi:hypothetical protein
VVRLPSSLSAACSITNPRQNRRKEQLRRSNVTINR